ncbi:uncharacterized protein LOC101676963 [Mustela putorius furo]|uniref:Uncharacterized protein LOC101676963 n=1 Tax=Mustela putorius furo TaxID=9669 RepID=A0A8U0SSU5_MUSPF|nr:uncharacterized protein LOC101676963 [Mustela putorius furo]
MVPRVRPCAPPSAGFRPLPRSPRPARAPPLPEPRLADQGCAFPGNPGLAWGKSELPGPRPTRNRLLRDAGLDPPVGSGSSRLVRSAFRLTPRATVKLPPRRLHRARLEQGWKQGNDQNSCQPNMGLQPCCVEQKNYPADPTSDSRPTDLGRVTCQTVLRESLGNVVQQHIWEGKELQMWVEILQRQDRINFSWIPSSHPGSGGK